MARGGGASARCRIALSRGGWLAVVTRLRARGCGTRGFGARHRLRAPRIRGAGGGLCRGGCPGVGSGLDRRASAGAAGPGSAGGQRRRCLVVRRGRGWGWGRGRAGTRRNLRPGGHCSGLRGQGRCRNRGPAEECQQDQQHIHRHQPDDGRANLLDSLEASAGWVDEYWFTCCGGRSSDMCFSKSWHRSPTLIHIRKCHKMITIARCRRREAQIPGSRPAMRSRHAQAIRPKRELAHRSRDGGLESPCDPRPPLKPACFRGPAGSRWRWPPGCPPRTRGTGTARAPAG